MSALGVNLFQRKRTLCSRIFSKSSEGKAKRVGLSDVFLSRLVDMNRVVESVAWYVGADGTGRSDELQIDRQHSM